MTMNQTAVSRLTDAMNAQHLSVNTLAKKSGISQPTLHRILTMQAEMTLDRLEKLCVALGVSVFDILKPKKKVTK